jgi:hypothetical protein
MYTVEVETRCQSAPPRTIYRRYSDFELLQEQLPQDAKSKISFPSRRFWARVTGSRLSRKSLEGRRQALSSYIGQLCDMDANIPILQSFLSDDWLRLRKPHAATAVSGHYILARNKRRNQVLVAFPPPLYRQPRQSEHAATPKISPPAQPRPRQASMNEVRGARSPIASLACKPTALLRLSTIHPRIEELKAEAKEAISGAVGDLQEPHIGRGTPAYSQFSRLPHVPIAPR